MNSRTLSALAVVLGIVVSCNAAHGVTLGISADGRFFTLDGVSIYLNGISYYGAGSITTPSFRTDDLDDMVADGFNWIRVWGYWKTSSDGGNEDVSALTHDGYARATYMNRLKALIQECDARGIIVDVSLNRDAAGTWVGARNQTEHLRAVQTIATELLAYRNVYIDISNERDVGDGRYVSLSECGQLINAIKAIDPARLCTASSCPTSQSQMGEFRSTAHMDFITPHLCRDSGCAAQTISKVKEYIGWMKILGWRIPIHLQEPFRRGYASYNPVLDDFLRDCNGGKIADAAGWCLHNGANMGDTRPHRCFIMTNTEGRLYSQWDSVELQVVDQIGNHVAGVGVFDRRYQPEYDEQLAKLIGRRDGEGRSANVSQDNAGFLTYGPYTDAFPPTTYQATWRMLIDDVTADNEVVVIVDVYDATGGQLLAVREVRRQEFNAANTYQSFVVTFTHTTAGHQLEFRTQYQDRCYLKIDYIDVRREMTPAAPAICEVSPDPDSAILGVEYTRQLLVCGGYPDPTWSVQQGPAGTQVDANGQVSGWTPAIADVGQTLAFTIRATNSEGQDDETWQVTVQDAEMPVFEDTLVDTSLITGQHGGTFIGNGYRMDSRTDFIWYNLDGMGADGTGSIECDATGLYPNAGAAKNHIMTTADRAGFCDSFTGPADPITNGWAIYASNYMSYMRKINYSDPAYDNRMKLSGSTLCDFREEFTPAAYSWDGSITYRFRCTWTGNRMRFYRGLPAKTLELLEEYSFGSSYTPAQFHVQLGGTSIAQLTGDIGGAPGTVYSLFRAYENDLGNKATPEGGNPPVYPPEIAEVSPDPDSIFIGNEYIRQLSLVRGSPSVTWSVVKGPSSAQVSQTGRLSGWTPTENDVGQTFTFEIQASNDVGSDTESWQVHVVALPEGVLGDFGFPGDEQGWTLETWKAGQYELAVISWQTTGGNPDGNMASVGSGATNGADSCTREGTRMTRVVSTEDYLGIQLHYDVVASLSTTPTSGCVGACTSVLLGGTCEDKLVVSYSTAGLAGPWTPLETLTEGVDLPTTWTTRMVVITDPAAEDNPSFAVKFEWQLNTSSDTGRIDNVRIYGDPSTVPADFDKDDDVDLDDFGHFQACLSGSSQPYGPGCADADLDPDGDVDVLDFAVFSGCMGGAGKPPLCD